MSGHSKWSTIKHKKAKTDAQKGKAFSRVGREITMAVKKGGSPDPSENSVLRLALQKAKEVNLPNENIKRAIQKGEGSSDMDQFEEVLFEAYGPAGVGILIEAITDNRNRTVPKVREILNKNDASMATQGAVSYQFERKAFFVFSDEVDNEQVMEVALELGADDIEEKEGMLEVLFPPEQYMAAVDAFDAAKLPYAHGAIDWLAANTIELSEEDAQKMTKLIDALEEDDDIQNVSSNMSF